MSIKPTTKYSVASVKRVVTYACGCVCEYPIKGEFAGLGWHIFPCRMHAGESSSETPDGRSIMEQRAEDDWRSISEKTNG